MYLDDDTPSTGHRVIFFDIEVSTKDRLPDIEIANNKITSIALHDGPTDTWHVLVLDEDNKQDNYAKDNIEVNFYRDEFDLLMSFLDLWEMANPTIISGWNSDHFDVPYVYRRMQSVLGPEEALRISPIRKIKFSNYRKKYQIGGISSLDYLDLYKKFTYTELPNYRLDTVAQHELGEGKIEYGGSLHELYERDIEEFIRYNLRDVELLVKMDKKMKLIELVRGICHIGHVPYEDYGFSSRFLEGTIVTYLHRKGLVVTDKDPAGRELMNNKTDEDKFAGAYVKTPNSAKYDWVYSLDLQSLYPSIIMSLNISPECKMAKVVSNFDIQKYNEGTEDVIMVKIFGENKEKLTYSELKKFVKSSNLTISSNGIMYKSPKKKIVGKLL